MLKQTVASINYAMNVIITQIRYVNFTKCILFARTKVSVLYETVHAGL